MVNIFSSLHVVRKMVFMLTLLIPWLNSTICSCHVGIIVLLTNFNHTLHVLQNMCATLFHSTSTMLKTHVMESECITSHAHILLMPYLHLQQDYLADIFMQEMNHQYEKPFTLGTLAQPGPLLHLSPVSECYLPRNPLMPNI